MLDSIFSGIGNIFSAIGNIPILIGQVISDFFTDPLGNILEFFANIFNTIVDILSAIIQLPFNIINGIINGLHALFIPPDNYFDNVYSDIKRSISAKIPYAAYIDIFGSLYDGSYYTGDRDLNIDLNNYKITDNLSVSVENFVDFGIITQYKDTWFHWVRGVVFVLLIIYNLNEIVKFLTGYGLGGITSSIRNGRGGGSE